MFRDRRDFRDAKKKTTITNKKMRGKTLKKEANKREAKKGKKGDKRKKRQKNTTKSHTRKRQRILIKKNISREKRAGK